MTREDIKKSNEDNKSSSRSPRVEDRESALTITLPDGRKLIRRPTENLNSVGYRLSAPKKTDFTRRWVSDEIDGRIQYYIDLGYTPATDELGQTIAPRRGGNRKNGSEYKMFLLEIPTKELERLKQQFSELDSSQKALENQNRWLEGGQVENGLNVYSPNKNKIKDINLK